MKACNKFITKLIEIPERFLFKCDSYFIHIFFLIRERDELVEMLAKHKSLLEQCRQREFEAYMEVKKSAETAENANLEKAEVKTRLQYSQYDSTRPKVG